MILFLRHVLDLTGGAFAGAMTVLFLHVLGLVLTSATHARDLRGSPHLTVTGAAVAVLWCWYGIKLNVTLTVLQHALLGCTLVLALFRRSHVVANVVDPEFNRQVWRFLATYSIFYALAYCFLAPPVSREFLPIVIVGNNDILNYLNLTSYLQRLGPSNIAGYTLVAEFYEQTPAVFYVLGAISLFFNGDVMQAAMPALFATVALIGCTVQRLSRSIFAVSAPVATCIAAVLIAGPFFRHIVGNYFLSQLLGTLAVLVLIGTTTELLEKQPAPRLATLVLLMSPYQYLIFYFYPSLLVISIGLQIAILGAFYWLFPSLLDGRRPGVAKAWQPIARWIAAVACCLAVVALLDLGHFRESIKWITRLSTMRAGWPLDFISPASIAGFPFSLELHRPMSKGLSIAALICLTIVIAYLYSKDRGDRARIGKSILLLATLAYGGYFVYFLLLGPSYQQWKLASYLPMTLSWVLWSAAVATGFPAQFMSRASGALRKAWGRAFFLTLFLALVTWNLFIHVRADPSPNTFSANYANLRSLDMIGGWQDVDVKMAGYTSTFFPVYFIPHKTLHLMSPSYYPMESLKVDEISPQRPFFVERGICEAGDPREIAVIGVGCLYLHTPFMKIGPRYEIGQIPTLVSNGLSMPEPEGRWSDGRSVELSFQVDGNQLASNPNGFINLNVAPFLHSRIDGQRVVVTWGDRRVAHESIRAAGWISLPYNDRDWGGNGSHTMTIKFELPDAIAPRDAGKRSGDDRDLAINFSLVSVSTVAMGQVLSDER